MLSQWSFLNFFCVHLLSILEFCLSILSINWQFLVVFWCLRHCDTRGYYFLGNEKNYYNNKEYKKKFFPRMPRKKPPAKLAFRKIERDQDLDQNQLSRGMFFYQTFIPSSIKIQTMTQIYTNCIYTTYSRIYCWKQRRSRAALIPSLPWVSWNS